MAKGLPPIGNNQPLPATPRGEFSHEVALRTGLNPWVIYAWTLSENDDRSVKRRPFNFLNFKSFDGKGGVRIGTRTYHARSCDPATDGGCFPGFADVRAAAAASADLIQRNYPTIRKTAGQPAGAQLSAIGHSQWGTNPSLLQKVYNQVLVTLYRGGNMPNVYGVKPNEIPSLPGGEQVPYQQPSGGLLGGLDSIGGFFETIGNAIRTLFSLAFWLRVGQVVAGGALILSGAYILSRGEMPGVMAAAAKA